MTARQREALAERLVRLLRETVPDAPLKRADVAFMLGVDLRTLRLVREIAEHSADFPTSFRNGYCRLYTRNEVAAEIRHRRACRLAYKFLLGKARTKQQELELNMPRPRPRLYTQPQQERIPL
jgi:hypothetical protein